MQIDFSSIRLTIREKTIFLFSFVRLSLLETYTQKKVFEGQQRKITIFFFRLFRIRFFFSSTAPFFALSCVVLKKNLFFRSLILFPTQNTWFLFSFYSFSLHFLLLMFLLLFCLGVCVVRIEINIFVSFFVFQVLIPNTQKKICFFYVSFVKKQNAHKKWKKKFQQTRIYSKTDDLERKFDFFSYLVQLFCSWCIFVSFSILSRYFIAYLVICGIFFCLFLFDFKHSSRSQ